MDLDDLDHNDDDDARVVRVRGPADILGVLPYRLGFHPTESIVVVCLDGPRRRDRLVMRLDLLDPRQDDAVALELARRVEHVGATAAVLVVYTGHPDGDGLARRELVAALDDALADVAVEVPEALLVRGDRWWSYLCDDDGCCPPGGTPLPDRPTPATTRYAAEAVAVGDAVLQDREALVRSVEPPDDPAARSERREAAAAADELLSAAEARGGPAAGRALTRSRLAALRGRWERGDRRVAADDAALVVLGLRDPRTRDELMTAVLDDDPHALVGLLGELVRVADDGVAAPVCTVLAWVAYATGHGALATAAAERAVRVEPGYPMAELVLDGMDRMVSPSELRAVSAVVRAELGTERAG